MQAGTAAAKKFQALVDSFTASGELQYYDTKTAALFLRNMPNNSTDLLRLRQRIRTVTEKFKLVVTNPFFLHSDIQILDVEVKTKISGNDKNQRDYYRNRRLKREHSQRQGIS